MSGTEILGATEGAAAERLSVRKPLESGVIEMKKFFGFGLLLVLIVACSDDEGPGPLTPPPAGLQMTLTVSPNRIIFGQSTTLTLRVENYGPDIELENDCFDHFGFRVEDSNSSFKIKFPLCMSQPHSYVIERGYKETHKFTIPYLRYNHPPLQPTHYVVSAGFLEHEDEYQWVEAELVVLHP